MSNDKESVKKLSISHTGKSMYLECPQKYKLHYVDNYRSSLVGSALIFGSCLDTALNEYLENKKDPIDVFIAEWDKTDGMEIEYFKSDTDEDLLEAQVDDTTLQQLSRDEKSWLSLKLKGIKLLEVYQEEVFPKIKSIKSVQRTIEQDNGHYVIKGVVDLEAELEDGVTYILDNKTTSTKYKLSDINTKDQLPMYSNALGYVNCGYITLDKKKFTSQILLGEVTAESSKRVKESFDEVVAKIQQNEFDKNKKSCYAFGRKCQFYSYCHYGKLGKDIYKKVKDS